MAESNVTTTHASRIGAALRRIGADALVCTLPSNVLLLSGYWPLVGTAIALVTSEGETYLIAPEDERIFAERATVDHINIVQFGSLDRITTLVEDVRPHIAKAFEVLHLSNARQIAVELGPVSEQAPYVAFTLYGSAMNVLLQEIAPSAQFVDAHDHLWRERAVLLPNEIEVIRRAADVVRQSYTSGVANIRVGATEIAASLPIERLLTECAIAMNRSDRAFGHVACMSGMNSGSAYGSYARSTRKTIAANELVLTHCNSTLDGYWTDVTRTYFIGEPPARVRKMYEALLKASRAGIAAVKPGIEAAAIDTAVRDSLGDDGFGQQFKHGTGHGVGYAAIDHRAKPRLKPGSPDVLEAGMIFNIEPGIYFEDFGGMRHCDMVLVTESGAELLTPFHNTIEELLLPA